MRKIFLPMMLLVLYLQSCGSKTPAEKSPEEKQPGTGAPVYGIDISSYQGDEADLLKRYKDSLTFIFCKATEGVDIEDPDFDSNWEVIRQNHFIRGAYHYYDCLDGALAQAAFFTAVVGELSPGDFPPIVDVEEAYSMQSCIPSAAVTDSLLRFLKQVQSVTGRIPVIYTDNPTADKYLSDPGFAQYPLYIAYWSDVASPMVPPTWAQAGWTLWQKSNDYVVKTITTDFDVFNGDLAAFKKFIRQH